MACGDSSGRQLKKGWPTCDHETAPGFGIRRLFYDCCEPFASTAGRMFEVALPHKPPPEPRFPQAGLSLCMRDAMPREPGSDASMNRYPSRKGGHLYVA
jgi:hypothetical protein